MGKEEAIRIFNEGEHLDNWACDFNPETKELESNGGKEHVLYDKSTDKFFLIATDWNNNPFTISEVDEKNELSEGGFIADIVKAFRASFK